MSLRGTDTGSSPTDGTHGGGLGGRVALLLVLVALFLGLGTLYGFGLYQAAVVADADAAALLPQVTAGLLALAFAPALGLLELQSGRESVRTDGRRQRPVRVIVWLGITALVVIVHAVASLVGGVSPLVVLGFAVAAVATGATSRILVLRAQAAAVRRLGARLADDSPTLSIDLDWTADTARRKWRLVGLSFVVALVVTVGGTLLLGQIEPQEATEAVALVLQFSLLAPALTCLVVSINAQFSSGSITYGLTKEDRKAVLRRSTGTGAALDPVLEWRAARLAVHSGTIQPFQLAQSAMLMVAVFVPTLIRGGFDGFLLVLWVVILAAYVVVLPSGIARLRRVRRFARTVGELARAEAPVGAAGEHEGAAVDGSVTHASAPGAPRTISD
jgi:hypothetical protein